MDTPDFPLISSVCRGPDDVSDDVIVVMDAKSPCGDPRRTNFPVGVTMKNL